MTAYDAGTAFLTIVPSFRGWDATVNAKIRETSALLQKGIADALPAGFRQGARAAAPEGTKTGDEFGGAFARSVRARIEAALKALPKVELRADSSDADVKLAAIRAELEDLRSKRIGIDIDEALALAQIARLQAELDRLGSESPNVAVRIDSARASEELAAVQAEVNHLDGQTANVHVKVDRDESGLGGGIGLGTLGLAASPALIPVGAATIGLGAGAATVLGAGAAGLGVLGLGLSGITKAVTDLTAANTQAGGAATAAGAAQVRATLAVAAAQRQVKASEDGLAQARANAADAAITAQERVQAALAAQAAAERNLTSAQQTQAQAQTALTEARKTAAQQLQDLSAQVTDGQLGLRQGQLDVTNARLNLQGVDSNPLSTQQQRQQAQLDYDQAVQHLKELQTQQGRLSDAQQVAAKKGVAGADVVVQAQRNLAAATQAVTDAYVAQAAAEQGVSDARRQQASQVRQSAYAIEQAQNSIISAQAALQSASLQSSTAGGALAQRVAVMSAPLKAFATFINDTLRPAFGKLRTAVQGALLPDLQAGLSSLLPVLPALTAFAVSLADTMGRLFLSASKALTSPFWQGFFTFVASKAGPVLSTFAHIIGNLITGFAGLLQAFFPVSKGIGDGILGLTQRFADFGTHLGSNSSFQAFLAYVRDNGPKVAEAIGQIATFAGHLIEVFAPLGAQIVALISNVAGFLNGLDPGQFKAIILSLAGLYAVIKAIGVITNVVKFATEAWSAATKIAALVSKAFAAAQWLINAALDANPIGLVILAVAALVAGLIYAYKHSETFRDIVKGAFQAVADAADFMWNKVLKPIFRFIIDAWLTVAGAIVHGAASAFGWVPGIGGKLKSAAKHFDDFAASVNASLAQIKGVTVAVLPGYVNPQNLAIGHQYALGGAVAGAGSWTSDSIPALLSTGEHVWPAREVAALGGQQAMYQLRHVLTGYASGGQVGSAGLASIAGGLRAPGMTRLDSLGGGRGGDLYYEQHLHYPTPDSVGHGQMRAQQLLLHDLSNR